MSCHLKIERVDTNLRKANMIENFLEEGCFYLGSGGYAAVLKHPERDSVTKIACDVGYFNFVLFVRNWLKHNNTKHLPRILSAASYFRKGEEEFQVYELERLYRAQNFFMRDGGKRGAFSYAEAYAGCLDELLRDSWHSAWGDITDENFSQLLRNLSSWRKSTRRHLDMHSGNIMFRPVGMTFEEIQRKYQQAVGMDAERAMHDMLGSGVLDMVITDPFT